MAGGARARTTGQPGIRSDLALLAIRRRFDLRGRPPVSCIVGVWYARGTRVNVGRREHLCRRRLTGTRDTGIQIPGGTPSNER